MGSRTVLLIDVGLEPMDLIDALARRLDFRVVRAKTTDEAARVLMEPRFAIGCVVIPPDLPVPHLGRALAALREAARSRDLPFLVAGRHGSEENCRALSAAGVSLPLWEPIDAHTLRFQLNRALAAGESFRRRRGSRRAPSNARALVHARGRAKEARLYTISAQGAFFATAMPSLRGTEVQIELPGQTALGRLAGQVVMTNVAGNLMKRNLPPGMAVRFERLRVEEHAALELHVERKLRRLEL
jgi:response regulator RpfG family c-di-GMP phosphodiesterase